MFGLGMPELIVILVIMLLLFGRRLPEVMRGMGKSVTEFKRGMSEVTDTVEQVRSSEPPKKDGAKKDDAKKDDAQPTAEEPAPAEPSSSPKSIGPSEEAGAAGAPDANQSEAAEGDAKGTGLRSEVGRES